jgi:hypothetical protein
VALAVLSDVSLSISLLATLAVLVIVPAALGVTTMVMVALAPLVSVPRLQVTVLPDRLQLPWLDEEETNVTLDGRVSVTLTFVAVPGPLLVMVIV